MMGRCEDELRPVSPVTGTAVFVSIYFASLVMIEVAYSSKILHSTVGYRLDSH